MRSLLKPYLLLLLLLLFAAGGARAQWLQGYIRDSVTHFPVYGATITNTGQNEKVQSDEKGFFRIRAVPNDLLYVYKQDYRNDTLRNTALFADTIDFYLSPTGALLPAVTVQARYTRYQMDSMDRKREFEENVGYRSPTVTRPQSGAFGVGISLDRAFKKKEKEKKQSERDYYRNEKGAYVAYRYSPHLVAYYTGMKGEALRQFMNRYTPTYEWLRQHPSNDAVLFYINDKLKLYKATQKEAAKGF